MPIGGATRLVGIIGDPVTHSLSPAIHNAAFAALGLDLAYVPLPVPAEQVGEAVAGLRALGFRGANVTMPHKAAVLPFLDEVSSDARLIDAVNTIVVDDERLIGHTTDGEGFLRALREVEPGGSAARLRQHAPGQREQDQAHAVSGRGRRLLPAPRVGGRDPAKDRPQADEPGTRSAKPHSSSRSWRESAGRLALDDES